MTQEPDGAPGEDAGGYAVRPAPHVEAAVAAERPPQSRREARLAGAFDTDQSSPAAATPPGPEPNGELPPPSRPRPAVEPRLPDGRGGGVRRDADGGIRFALSPGELPDGRATLVERLGIVFAILVPPLGLVTGIAAAVSSERRRGWVSRISVTAIALSLVMAALFVVGAIGLVVAVKAQQRHDARVAAAAPFCKVLRDAKIDVDDPGFGWPAQGATVDATLTAMGSFVTTWTAAQKVAPSDIRASVAKVVTLGTELQQRTASSRQVDIDADLADWDEVHSSSVLPSYVASSCS